MVSTASPLFNQNLIQTIFASVATVTAKPPVVRPGSRIRMSIGSEAESALHARVADHILRESQRDVDALYRFIDPAVRESRDAKYDIEPEHTISQIREYTSRIDSAELVSFAIDGSAVDGGVGRGNVPTAIVLLTVYYNNRGILNEFRTPWVFRDDQWYTRATGKITVPPAVQGRTTWFLRKGLRLQQP